MNIISPVVYMIVGVCRRRDRDSRGGVLEPGHDDSNTTGV